MLRKASTPLVWYTAEENLRETQKIKTHKSAKKKKKLNPETPLGTQNGKI